MGTPEIGKIVRYMYGGKVFPAIITQAEDKGVAYITVFGPQGYILRKAHYSETFSEGKWSWAPQKKKE